MKKYVEIQEKTNEFEFSNPQKFVKELTTETYDEIVSIVMTIIFVLGGSNEDYDIKIHYCYHEEGTECMFDDFKLPIK